MRLLEIIQNKEVDIYLGLATTVLGVVLGVIVDILRKGGASNHTVNIGYQTQVTVTNINNVYNQQRNSGQQDDQGMIIVFSMLLFFAGLIYLFFRSQILHSFTITVLFILSMWTGITIHSLMQGYFSGARWAINLFFSMAFCAVTIFIADKAATPNYSPKYFFYSQQIVNEQGIKGLGNYFSLLDLKWFTFHLLGVLIFFSAKTRMTLSVVYFSVMSTYLARDNRQSELPWLAKKTAKYGNVYKNIVVTSLMLIVSYYLVAGNFFMWFEYEFPNQMQGFIQRVINGRG